MLLTEHIVKCDAEGRDWRNWWYHWTLGRLKQVFCKVISSLIAQLYHHYILSLSLVVSLCEFKR